MATKRINPDHKYLTDNGWIKSDSKVFGNRVQQLWSHHEWWRAGAVSTDFALYVTAKKLAK